MFVVGPRPASATVFFFNDTATTEIYTLSLHDALPILAGEPLPEVFGHLDQRAGVKAGGGGHLLAVHNGLLVGHHVQHVRDRKTTRLNSSHANISYAVFCLKKKKITTLSHKSHSTSLA